MLMIPIIQLLLGLLSLVFVLILSLKASLLNNKIAIVKLYHCR